MVLTALVVTTRLIRVVTDSFSRRNIRCSISSTVVGSGSAAMPAAILILTSSIEVSTSAPDLTRMAMAAA